MMSVLHVGHADDGIGDPVVDHGVHGHRDGVLGEELLWGHPQGDGSQVHLLVGLDTWQHDKQSWK